MSSCTGRPTCWQGRGGAAGDPAGGRAGRPRDRLDRAHRRPGRRRRAAGAAGQPGPGRGRLVPGRHLVGRRALAARRRPRAQRQAGPGRAAVRGARSTRRGCTRSRPPTVRTRATPRPPPRRTRPSSAKATRPGGPRPGAAVRRAHARGRRGGARRLDLPGVAGRVRDAAGGRGPRLPEAAADPALADLPRDRRGHRGVARWRPARRRPARSRWPSAAPARSRSRRPACTAGPAPSGCSTASRGQTPPSVLRLPIG